MSKIELSVSTLALAIDHDNGNAAFKWTRNGRSDIRRMNSVGCFIMDLPVTFAIGEGLSVEEFLYEVADHSVSVKKLSSGHVKER